MKKNTIHECELKNTAMPGKYRLSILAVAACVFWPIPGGPLRADPEEQLTVGVQPDGRIVVPTNQVLSPAGKQITFVGRPVDLAWADEGKTLVVKNMRNLLFIDPETAKVRQTLESPVGFSVVGLVVHGERIFASDAQNHVRVARRQQDGSYQWDKPIPLDPPKVGKAAHPAGLALLGKDKLWVASTRGNNVQLIDLDSGKVEQVVPVGVAPYTIVCPRPDRCYVSNWGGDPPKEGDPQAKSSGSPIRVDPKTSVANDGTVSVLELVDKQWKQTKTIRVGLHPCGMTVSPRGKFLYVANANSDSVSIIITKDESRPGWVDEEFDIESCRPEARLPFGSGSNALALGPDGHTLFVANGTNNCIAMISLGAPISERGDPEHPRGGRFLGLIPTGWYPGAVLLSADGKKLVVANVKGHGSLSRQKAADKEPRPENKGRNSHDHLGSVSIIDVPDADQLKKYTEAVNVNNRLAYSLAGLEKPRAGVPPVPVPVRHGEPSVFEHVIYVIKENRTYDQVFGDMKEGNGDPSLCIFGAEVTPNQHALARQFTLFDNFYCSGVLSADGHSWVNEAYVTDYLEKSFGGFTRSYPYEGSDPLAFPASGFLWDNALAHKKTFYNYGEFTESKYPRGTTWTSLYDDYKNGTRTVKIAVKANLKSLEPYTRPGYPGFPLTTPDVYRAELFLEDLRGYEKKGDLPNLTYIFLPCNHTNGTKPGIPTPRAMVADNDLALGRIVEAVSKSKFWPKTCIFVVEDDPQNGFDHVDGHRTVALAVSPYTKRKFVDRTNYNQTGMVKTIELVLGLPPMNQLDLSATALRNCFQAEPDLTPFVCLPNKVPLDQMNPPLKKLQGQALHWAQKSLALNFDQVDAADEDTLNRILWHAARGDETPYPRQFINPRRAEP